MNTTEYLDSIIEIVIGRRAASDERVWGGPFWFTYWDEQKLLTAVFDAPSPKMPSMKYSFYRTDLEGFNDEYVNIFLFRALQFLTGHTITNG